MKFAEAKQLIVELQYFVQLVESYTPTSFETVAIYEYALEGNVIEVAKKLAEQGYQVEGRKISSSDVSAVLQQKPINDLHKVVSKMFKSNKKRVQNFT